MDRIYRGIRHSVQEEHGSCRSQIVTRQFVRKPTYAIHILYSIACQLVISESFSLERDRSVERSSSAQMRGCSSSLVNHDRGLSRRLDQALTRDRRTKPNLISLRTLQALFLSSDRYSIRLESHARTSAQHAAGSDGSRQDSSERNRVCSLFLWIRDGKSIRLSQSVVSRWVAR